MDSQTKRGFTLVELIMVIVILGILAAVAIPKFFDLSGDANTAAEKGVLGGVRAGIATYLAKNKVFPPSLDGATAADCSTTNVCFDTVLAQGGITDAPSAGGWQKTSVTPPKYKGPVGTTEYTYTSSDGSFK